MSKTSFSVIIYTIIVKSKKTMKKWLIILVTALAIFGCKSQFVPIQDSTQVNIVDSVAIHYLDSVRIVEQVKIRDYKPWLDTLRLQGNRSRAWAVADTTKELLVGELQEDELVEKVRYEYRDRWHYKDSIRKVEVPVRIKVTEYKTPKWSWWSLVINILGVIGLCFFIYLKVKGLPWRSKKGV